MARATLPPHHVPRPRLIVALGAEPLALVVAGGGHGKTVLARELANGLDTAAAFVRLEPGDEAAALLVGRLRRALRRSGLSDAAAALADPGAGEGGAAIERLLDVLSAIPDPVLLVLDGLEHGSGGSAEAIARLAGELAEPHRLLLLGRSLPPVVAAAGDDLDAPRLGPRELAFRPDEVEALVASRGVRLGPEGLERLLAATGGWPAAVGLAAERLAAVPDPEAELDRLAGGGSLVVDLVERQLALLPPERVRAAVQVAHLPLLVPAVADAVTGVAGSLRLLEASGLPLLDLGDGSAAADLPGPVRDALAARAPLGRAEAARAASAYAARGLVAEAVRVQLSAGDGDGAAATLGSLPPGDAGRLDFGELRALTAAIGREAVDRQPRALLALARACEAAAEAALRRDALDRAAAAVARGDDPALAREIDAERARDLVRDGAADEAFALAERLLAEAAADELQTRVRALHVLGRTYARRGDAVSLAAAEPLLLEAAELYRRLGNATSAAHALLGLAFDVYTLGGRLDDAVACLTRAGALVPVRSRLGGVIAVFRAEALSDLGRDDDAEAANREAERLASLFGDARTLAYVAWVRARIAASRGDAAAAAAFLAAAERHPGDWFAHQTGAEFLAEAALLLDGLGDAERAAAYLARAQERAAEAPLHLPLAAGAIAARSGDPVAAEQLLAPLVARDDLGLRERWRVLLLRARAAQRRGDDATAGRLAREAFAAAATAGVPGLPALREPVLTAGLLGLAGEGALGPVADGRGAVTQVQLLGGFAVLRAGRPVDLPPGRPTALVKLLAVRGGRVGAEEAIEALWPQVEPTSGRKRLRNVLARIRVRAGDLLERDEAALALAGSVVVDAAEFEAAAQAALAAAGTAEADARARAALALHPGELLPDDRYEDWAAGPRERLRSLLLAVLDELADGCEEAGDLDEALRLLAHGIEVDRLDESRYLRSARLLLRQGRRGRALDTLRQAAGALQELGLHPSAEHRALVLAART